jgi:hypothetical protein
VSYRFKFHAGNGNCFAVLCGVFLFLGVHTLYAQFNYNAILPPSPTASSLGKYGDVPASLYTGIPSVDVPLYELAGNQLKLPISLSYRASGQKVEESSSWVGLGFTHAWFAESNKLIGKSIGIFNRLPGNVWDFFVWRHRRQVKRTTQWLFINVSGGCSELNS